MQWPPPYVPRAVTEASGRLMRYSMMTGSSNYCVADNDVANIENLLLM